MPIRFLNPLMAAVVTAVVLPALAVTPAAADDAERLDELERRQTILTEEIRNLRQNLTVPDSTSTTDEYAHGHHGGAAKVYGIQRGVSLGGYGEFNYKNSLDDGADDEFDFLRFVLYVGYKYNDWIVLNSELEFEHASTSSTESSGSGSVSVEFAELDFLLHPMANVRLGMVLMPVGFVNEMHEPPFFHGNERPPVETQVIPSTWRTNGGGLFGELAPGLEYRTYVVTSLNAKGFSSSNLRSGRQKGNRELANDFSWVGRVDYTLLPGLTFGGSAFLGNQGGDQNFAGEDDPRREVDAFLQLYEGHAAFKRYGLELRGLVTHVDLDDAGVLSADPEIDQTIAEEMIGYYLEAAYDVMPLFSPGTTQYLAPWFRYSKVDTQSSVPAGFAADPTRDRDFYELGVSYKPIPEVVLKADYRILEASSGDPSDEIRLGAGFVF